eukprot:m.70609 g.70609  ORF g.70609 m.70609 type:complete len:97 (+) comp50144_c0_seq8:1766-2056(+)
MSEVEGLLAWLRKNIDGRIDRDKSARLLKERQEYEASLKVSQEENERAKQRAQAACAEKFLAMDACHARASRLNSECWAIAEDYYRCYKQHRVRFF